MALLHPVAIFHILKPFGKLRRKVECREQPPVIVKIVPILGVQVHPIQGFPKPLPVIVHHAKEQVHFIGP